MSKTSSVKAYAAWHPEKGFGINPDGSRVIPDLFGRKDFTKHNPSDFLGGWKLVEVEIRKVQP